MSTCFFGLWRLQYQSRVNNFERSDWKQLDEQQSWQRLHLINAYTKRIAYESSPLFFNEEFKYKANTQYTHTNSSMRTMINAEMSFAQVLRGVLLCERFLDKPLKEVLNALDVCSQINGFSIMTVTNIYTNEMVFNVFVVRSEKLKR